MRLDRTPLRLDIGPSLWVFFALLGWAVGLADVKLLTRDDIKDSIEVFGQPNVKSYGQLLFDIQRYQLIVGSRDYLFRLTLEGLSKLEEAHWSAQSEKVQTCLLKGKSEEDCRNYIKVLVTHGDRVFTCGTNAFSPECCYRDIDSLKSQVHFMDGRAKCPYSPDANSTSLMTQQGIYYIGSTIDFSGQDAVILKLNGTEPHLRTWQFDPKWLSDSSFVASYEIDDFVYFFFREAAVEYMNCGKVIYSRVARVCKNDQGGQFQLKDKFTTFLKARLNCSVPGDYPFYYDEIQSIHYVEREEVFYATFTTPVNSIYGSAVCSFNLSSITNSFTGAFKYQSSPKAAWERQVSPHKHFQCQTPGSDEHLLRSETYQLMDEPVRPLTPQPILKIENERLNHIAVDTVQTKHLDNVHVMFVASGHGVIRKIAILPKTRETCLIEKIKVFRKDSSDEIKTMKLLKDTNSLYIGSEESVQRLLIHRCSRFLSKTECLSAMDPYCGWDPYKLQCTTAPNRNPHAEYWMQEKITCPKADLPVDGGWGLWTPWSECSHIGVEATGDHCMCQKRLCDNPAPQNGGKECEGMDVHVSNCTRDGQWTEWSSRSACSQSCGIAVKSRRKSCGNPAPAFGGKLCVGQEREEMYCVHNPPCPDSAQAPVDGHWSQWSTWDRCSSPCGGSGFQSRHRRCNSPPPQHAGRQCPGCAQEHRSCGEQACPEVRKWSGWSAWRRVNRTAEGHFEERVRFGCRAVVADESQLRVERMRKEERFCGEGDRSCQDSGFLSVDGGWSNWSPWSYCSATCGGGVQYRERACDSPRPSGSGSDCVGSPRMDRPCNTQICEDSEGWGEWTAWSLCNEEREQQRQRKCIMPQVPNSLCQGPSKEIRMCIPEQIEASQRKENLDDGIHGAHVAGSFISGVLLGLIISAIAFYIYTKRRGDRHTHIATQLIPVKPNTYVSQNDWNNFATKLPTQKIPLREATIKRNGSIRTQLQSENF